MDHYQLLNISRAASPQEIKKAYRREAMIHHPDRGGNSDYFRSISDAYETLIDSNARDEYDATIMQTYAEQSFNMYEYSYEQNKDIEMVVNVELKDVLEGKRIVMQYDVAWQNKHCPETVNVDIPKGAKNGDVIRFCGLGHARNPHMTRGDLKIKIKVVKDGTWERDGNDLVTNAIVNSLDLVTGCAIIVTTLDNKQLKLTIPKCTQTGQVFSIKGEGIPDLNTGQKGNIYVIVDAKTPNISDYDALEQLKKIRNIN